MGGHCEPESAKVLRMMLLSDRAAALPRCRFGVGSVDLWSLDVEGAELEVLKTVDFGRFQVCSLCLPQSAPRHASALPGFAACLGRHAGSAVQAAACSLVVHAPLLRAGKGHHGGGEAHGCFAMAWHAACCRPWLGVKLPCHSLAAETRSGSCSACLITVHLVLPLLTRSPQLDGHNKEKDDAVIKLLMAAGCD